MKKTATPLEDKFEEIVKSCAQEHGAKVKRDARVGSGGLADYQVDYLVTFANGRKIDVEIDHESQHDRALDDKRDKYLSKDGIEVVRLSQKDLAKNGGLARERLSDCFDSTEQGKRLSKAKRLGSRGKASKKWDAKAPGDWKVYIASSQSGKFTAAVGEAYRIGKDECYQTTILLEKTTRERAAELCAISLDKKANGFGAHRVEILTNNSRDRNMFELTADDEGVDPVTLCAVYLFNGTTNGAVLKREPQKNIDRSMNGKYYNQESDRSKLSDLYKEASSYAKSAKSGSDGRLDALRHESKKLLEEVCDSWGEAAKQMEVDHDFYLNIPYQENKKAKQTAKEHKTKIMFDNDRKKWFVPRGKSLEPFIRWTKLPSNSLK